MAHRSTPPARRTLFAVAAVAAAGVCGCATLGSGRGRARVDIPVHVEPEWVSAGAVERSGAPERAAANDDSPRHHVVQPGETLYRIAKNHGTTVEALVAANDWSTSKPLAVGQRLVLPTAGRGQSPSVASRPGGSSAPRAPSDPPDARAGTLQWPLKGVLYARFGRKGKERHDGIDLAAPAGTPVHTAAPGVVLFSGEQRGYGNIVIVEHSGGLITLYAHNRDLRVKTGQRVRERQVVATVGESGRTSGPHLHFELRKDGVPVDPMPYLGRVPSS